MGKHQGDSGGSVGDKGPPTGPSPHSPTPQDKEHRLLRSCKITPSFLPVSGLLAVFQFPGPVHLQPVLFPLHCFTYDLILIKITHKRKIFRRVVIYFNDAVKIGDQWKAIEDIDMNKLAKSSFTVNDPSDM